VLCCVVLCCVALYCVVLCCVVLCGVVWCCVRCVVVLCAVEQESGAMARREPQDLSVTVELGLCLCSRLPGKIDNQTEVTRRQIQ
jgi:hypothetical protein